MSRGVVAGGGVGGVVRDVFRCGAMREFECSDAREWSYCCIVREAKRLVVFSSEMNEA